MMGKGESGNKLRGNESVVFEADTQKYLRNYVY